MSGLVLIMTLALLISLCLLCSASIDALAADVRRADIRSMELEEGGTGQQDSTAKPADPPNQSNAADDKTTEQPAQSSPALGQTPPAPTSAAKKPSATPQNKTSVAKRKLHHKKAPVEPNCNSGITGDTSAKPSSQGSEVSSSAPSNSVAGNNSSSNNETATGSGNASTKCPPAKVIVHDGGTSEPTVQLTRDAAIGPASPQAGKTDQLLGSTEENLKKLSGHQLSASQKEMVSQIRQYMEQSKTATASGDVERGRSLALKANLLSQELAKP
jgi:hypothetical protein